MSKKLVSVVLTAVTAVSMSGALLAPVANAQSTADLQAQIAALLAQIQTLQSQLNSAQGGARTSYNFTRNLTVGSRGADVTALQNILGVSPATGYFGALTKAALMRWQASVGISATGFFGPL